MVFRRSLSRLDSCAKLTGSISLHRYVEEAEFTPLHLAIVGVLQVDLANMLQSPDCAGSIEARTADGLTPLHLATIRGDEQAAKLLIRAGAYPDSQTLRGRNTARPRGGLQSRGSHSRSPRRGSLSFATVPQQ
jgi:hypothetical protein